MAEPKKATAKSPAAKSESKPKPVKMYNAEQDRTADVHPEMVSEYEAGGFVKK